MNYEEATSFIASMNDEKMKAALQYALTTVLVRRQMDANLAPAERIRLAILLGGRESDVFRRSRRKSNRGRKPGIIAVVMHALRAHPRHTGRSRDCCHRSHVAIAAGQLRQRYRARDGEAPHREWCEQPETLDPGGTLSKWVGHVVQTAATGQGAARTIAGGEIMEILAPMAREAGGSLNIGVRLFRATGDEAWNLTTILTRQ